MSELTEAEKKAWGYWVLGGKDFMEALERVAAGDSPEIVYAEYYANSNIEKSE